MASSNILVTIQTPFIHKNVLLPRGKQLAYSINNQKEMRELYELMSNPHAVQGVYLSEQDKKNYDKYIKEKYDLFGNKLFRNVSEMNSSYLEPPIEPEKSPFLNPVVISKKEDKSLQEKDIEEKIEMGLSTLLMDNNSLENKEETLERNKKVRVKEEKEEIEILKEEQKIELEEEVNKRFNHLTSAHYTKIQDRAAELNIEYTVKDKTILEIIKVEFQENAKQLKLEDYLDELINSK